jgi:hypothetical protein
VDDQRIGVALNRNLGSPTARGEAVEAELNRLIQRRFRQKDPDEGSELWKASERRYNARKQEQLQNEWCEYHQGQAARLRAVFESLIAPHEEQAAKLMDSQPDGRLTGGGASYECL